MKSEINYLALGIAAVLGLVLYFIPAPVGLTENAWHVFAIFMFVILGIILKAAPMGTMSFLAIALIAVTAFVSNGDIKKAIEISLSGFANATIWLITLSFFIARGFIKTGLGTRIAFIFVKFFGRSPLGIAYGLNIADLVMAPAIPSNTARGGGIIYPVMKSIAVSFDSKPEVPESHRRIGSFLTLNSYNANLITSSMFLTATASNPMAQKFAKDLGIDISWGLWAWAALVPGLLTLIVMPYFLFKVYPPELKDTKSVQALASTKLQELGALKKNEVLMLVAFVGLMLMWIFGDKLSIEATTAGFIGLCGLLLTNVLTWEDIKSEKGAWDTMVWFSALVMLGGQLNSLGFISWMTHSVQDILSGYSWLIVFPLVVVIYFYTHYFFASATAHVASMYVGFLSLGLAAGVPGLLLAMVLGHMGGIMGTLTHYGHGPAPVFFGSTYVELKDWWRLGFFLSLLYMVVWMGSGALWWKIIGLY